jgi:hypothetical protein
MNMLKAVSIAVALALLVLAVFLGWTPWRAHGGRFITEYLALAGAVALVALVILAAGLLSR